MQQHAALTDILCTAATMPSELGLILLHVVADPLQLAVQKPQKLQAVPAANLGGGCRMEASNPCLGNAPPSPTQAVPT